MTEKTDNLAVMCLQPLEIEHLSSLKKPSPHCCVIGYFKIFRLEDLCSNAGQRPSVMHSMVFQRQLQHRQHVVSFGERNNTATRRLLKMLGVNFIIGSHD